MTRRRRRARSTSGGSSATKQRSRRSSRTNSPPGSGGLEAALSLPPGHTLAPTTLFEGGAEGHYLTLSVFEIVGAMEGTRAEWSEYVDDDSGRPPHLMILDLMTEEVAFDPYSIINLPSEVRHRLADGEVSTRLSSAAVAFDASFDTVGVTDHELALDWIEAGDIVCRARRAAIRR